jgi:hypothetical protein
LNRREEREGKGKEYILIKYMFGLVPKKNVWFKSGEERGEVLIRLKCTVDPPNFNCANLTLSSFTIIRF